MGRKSARAVCLPNKLFHVKWAKHLLSVVDATNARACAKRMGERRVSPFLALLNTRALLLRCQNLGWLFEGDRCETDNLEGPELDTPTHVPKLVV